VGGGFRTPDYVADLGMSGRDLSPVDGPLSRQVESRRLLEKPRIALDDLFQIAALGNPEIAAAGNEVGAAAGRAWQAELYPNPTLELEAEDIPSDDFGMDRSVNTIAITQPVILGGRRAAALSAASAERKARRFALESRRRDVFGEIRLAYTELLYEKEAIVLYAELLDVARQTLKIAATRFDARAAPEVEVIKSQIEVHELELGLRRLERQVVSSSERLSSLLGGVKVPVERVMGALPTDFPELDLERLRAVLREGHPDLLSAQAEAEAAERRIERAKAERLPVLDIRVGYGRDAATAEDFLQAGIGVPLPFFNRSQGRILEARHLAAKARRDTEAMANRLSAELAAAHVTYMTARDEVATFRDRIVPAATRALSQAREGYQAGRASLLDLLDAQRTLARARLSLLGSQRDGSLARARLWKIVGAAVED
jgi:cobalt-zinc-cadmium efflux system outer membrane protein